MQSNCATVSNNKVSVFLRMCTVRIVCNMLIYISCLFLCVIQLQVSVSLSSALGYSTTTGQWLVSFLINISVSNLSVSGSVGVFC